MSSNVVGIRTARLAPVRADRDRVSLGGGLMARRIHGSRCYFGPGLLGETQLYDADLAFIGLAYSGGRAGWRIYPGTSPEDTMGVSSIEVADLALGAEVAQNARRADALRAMAS